MFLKIRVLESGSGQTLFRWHCVARPAGVQHLPAALASEESALGRMSATNATPKKWNLWFSYLWIFQGDVGGKSQTPRTTKIGSFLEHWTKLQVTASSTSAWRSVEVWKAFKILKKAHNEARYQVTWRERFGRGRKLVVCDECGCLAEEAQLGAASAHTTEAGRCLVSTAEALTGAIHYFLISWLHSRQSSRVVCVWYQTSSWLCMTWVLTGMAQSLDISCGLEALDTQNMSLPAAWGSRNYPTRNS